ncbi:MAG TPA: serine/threonine-protein kinase [Kofleriaceae bacterium]|nr:serine/threonine-protein kinase [Kofleriaceae bacterium]
MPRDADTDPDRTKVSIVDPLVGTVLDRRYRIEFRLAAGGFGAIYRATHVITRREVAIKVLHPSLASEPNVVARFRREAEALGALKNSHTVRAFDFGETDGMLYIVMELLQGESLYERYRALGPLPWRRMLKIACEVCESLAEAHALGIVHRDLKPTNIHLERIGGDDDYVKILDFGIAKILHGSALDNADLTRSGQMIGTFDYMAPEQMVGSHLTGQSDIYTLGLVIYEMLTGERPFGDPPSPSAMLQAMIMSTPPSVSSRSDAPEEIDAIVVKCLARDPDHRWRSVEELRAEIERVLENAGDPTQTQLTRAPSGPFTAPTMDAVEPDDTEIGVDKFKTTLPGVMMPPRRKR